MQEIDYSKLTPEQKQALREQMDAEIAAEKAAAKQQKQDYISLKDEQVKATFLRLGNISSTLEAEKIDIFNQFGSLVAMKKELYELSDAQMEIQQSHTFTTADGKMSIIIGSNVIDRWSDDVNVGVDGVNTWLDRKITDPNAREIIRTLLKPNKDGVLKASRVLDLSKKAAEIGDPELIKCVDFIRDQYRPVKTSTFVKAKYLDNNGLWQWLPLAMSQV